MADRVRTIDASDIDGWVECKNTGFLGHTVEGEAEFHLREIDLDRTWGAFDGDRVVGTLRSFRTPLTVPGPAVVDAAALTNVAVAPTHRRRGLLREMITNDLRSSAERGEPVGILIASEYPIYGRFGYGAAVDAATYTVDATTTRFRDPGVGDVELVGPATLRREAPPVYERFRAAQPGSIGRTALWWDRTLRQIEVPGPPPDKGFQALYRSPDGEAEGYVRYGAKQEWDQMRPKATLTISELVATTPAAYHRLWRYCCEVDLITTVHAGDRSIHEPLHWLLGDGRAIRQTSRYDFIWVRVLHVGAALAARRYLVEGELVIEVVDPLGIAGGRFALAGGPAGASCTPSDASAELTLPVDALGSVYLGGVSMRALADAGRVDEHRPGALARADAMFRSALTPWCSTWF
jgi:predicted acetyltransferase